MVKTVGQCLLACAFACGSICAPIGFLLPTADLNGDWRVDVRDVQFVITRLALAHGQSGVGDVNADGHIDVLDFQCILGKTRDTGAHERKTEPDQDHHALPVVRAEAPARNYELKRVLAILSEYRELPGMMGIPAASSILPPPRMKRLVQCLAPNAPPFVA